jgi:hypothetical protein
LLYPEIQKKRDALAFSLAGAFLQMIRKARYTGTLAETLASELLHFNQG